LYLTVTEAYTEHDASSCDECASFRQKGEEVQKHHETLHQCSSHLYEAADTPTADCLSCAAHLSELRNLRTKAQAMEDAHIGKAIDPQHCTSCAAMKGEILDHIQRDKTQRDMHGGCASCDARISKGDAVRDANKAYEEAMNQHRDSQCSRFTERTIVIRLHYGANAESINAKFDNEQLTFAVKKQHSVTKILVH